MKEQEVPDQMVEFIKLNHEQWLQSPVTQGVIQGLRKFRESLTDAIAANATTENQFVLRNLASSLKNTDAILATITDVNITLQLITTKKSSLKTQ